jgi:hypothetical protein
MAFIRKKKTTVGIVYQVVESRREGKKVRQRVLVSLMYDPTIKECLSTVEKRIADRYTTQDWRERWLALKRKLNEVQKTTGLP